MNTRRIAAAMLASSIVLGLAACEEPIDEAYDEDTADVLPKDMVFDVEYKKLDGGKLLIKQIRPVPQSDGSATIPPFLVKRARRVCTAQREGADVFASHRNKAIISLDSKSVRLTTANMKLPLLSRIDAQINALDGSTVQVTGDPAKLPQPKHQLLTPPLGFSGKLVSDGWTIGSGAAKRAFALSLNLGEPVSPSTSPITLLEDTSIALNATFSTPAPILVLDFENDGFKPGTRTDDETRLGSCPEDTVVEDAIQHRELRNGSMVIDTQFQFAQAPDGVFVKTAALGRWIETKITGLTTEPIILRGFFSQTFQPGHHNFFEHFIFEPRLEPGISSRTLDELEAKDVRQIVVMNSGGINTVTTVNARFFKLGSSGRYEPLP